MGDDDSQGRPAVELSDDELEQQGTQAHETRNWVFLHGSAEQFANHTTRMLALEDEYVRRHPRRTWQGSGGAPTGRSTEVADTRVDPETAFLQRIADAPGGRLHRLEAHQAAREVGLDRTAVARLYNTDPPLLATERHERVITDAGRARLLRPATTLHHP